MKKNNGEKRRNKSRQRVQRAKEVRHDRTILIILLIVAVIIIIFLGIKVDKLEKQLNGGTIIDNSSEIITTTEAETTAPETTETTETQPAETTTEAAEKKEGYKGEEHLHDEIYSGNLVAVNAENEYKFMEDDVNLVNIIDVKNHNYSVSENQMKLDEEVVTQINDMMTAFLKAEDREDSNIWLVEGFRDYDSQSDKYYGGTSIFSPGHSEYHTGRTFDFAVFTEEDTSYYFSPKDEYEWFADNASKFGFVIRFPEGKDEITGEKFRARTYRYVGVPHAEYMYDNNLCLEEYIELLKSHTKDEPIEFADDNHEYMIYYSEAGDSVKAVVPVPEDYEYSVSGNNEDGFIVTIIRK